VSGAAGATCLIVKRAFARFVRVYLTADLRSLAAGRIAMALVLLLDLGKRWVQLGSWYTNAGLVPNHTLLWRPSFDKVFSFFYMASYSHEAVLGFVVCAIAYTTLLVGFRTRLAQVASLLCVLSLHGRLLLFDNGGDVVLGLLCVWTTFLPTGRFWSVDAVLARRDPPVAPMGGAAPVPAVKAEPPTQVVSLGALALTFQLAFIYLFNAIHKGGATWRDGSAVHYVLHLDLRPVAPRLDPTRAGARAHLELAGNRMVVAGAAALAGFRSGLPPAGHPPRDPAAHRIRALPEPGQLRPRDDRLHPQLHSGTGLGDVRTLVVARPTAGKAGQAMGGMELGGDRADGCSALPRPFDPRHGRRPGRASARPQTARGPGSHDRSLHRHRGEPAAG
jgi:hypothetical protein